MSRPHEEGNPNPDLATSSMRHLFEVRPAMALLLAVTVPWGCSSLGVGPTAEFQATARFGAAPFQVEFTDLSSPGSSSIEEWTWRFGDGEKSSERNPVHIYEAAGTYDVSLLVSSNAGADLEFKTGFVVVSPKPAGPDAEFSGAPRSGGKPLTVQFTDQSNPGTGTITSWSWSFGDGGTSASRNPSHAYETEGVYDVSLVVQTSVGSNVETKSDYIAVSAGPTAAFTGAPRNGTRPLTVQFTDQSTSGTSAITGWSWSFGDGGVSTSQSPSHTYTAAGSYTVSLTVTTADGSDAEAKSGYVLVSDPTLPVAAFSGTPRSGNIPLVVQFTDQSSAGTYPITSRSWSFGDGTTSTAQNPSHTYGSTGSFDVSLTVTTSAGSDDEIKSAYIVAGQPPHAAFEGTPRTGDRPLTVQFSDLSTDGSAPITSWSWSFGDGAASASQNPAHTYDAAGTYTVALTVTTSDGSDTATEQGYITVTEPPAPPTADFSASPTSGPAPLTVQFTDLSTQGTAPITSWLWSFGDGGTGTAQSPIHTYLLPGTYAVSLTVTTADGSDSATKEGYVTACALPTAEFLAEPTTGPGPLTVQFTDLSVPGEGPIGSWSWSFGDGGTSAEQNPSHAYVTPGVYDVSLSVSGDCGSDAEVKSGYVTVQDPCTTAVYSIADARVEIRADSDQDSCANRARVHFDADVEADCSRSVFTRVLLRPEGSTEWTFEFQSACFTITGASTADANWIQVQNLPQALYEIRIELYECGGALPVASRDYLDDPDLDSRCFE